jgi:hypothetical protein
MNRSHIQRIRNIFVAATLCTILTACGSQDISSSQGATVPGGGGTPTPDAVAPVFTITAPTTGTSYTATSATITVSGTATDNVGLSQITWSNSRGGSGSVSVSGISANRSFNIALVSGTNVLTLTVLDTSGNTGQKQLTVTYNPGPVTSNSATLAWDAVVAPNVSGYRVYYGTTPGVYGPGLSIGNVTTYTVSGLSNGTRYYFAVTAFDASGNESGYSNEAFKDIP